PRSPGNRRTRRAIPRRVPHRRAPRRCRGDSRPRRQFRRRPHAGEVPLVPQPRRPHKRAIHAAPAPAGPSSDQRGRRGAADHGRTRVVRRAGGRAMRVAAGILVRLAVLLLPGAMLVGCGAGGYTFTSSYATDVSTVAVEIFRNDTFEPGLEAELAEALTKEVQRVTPWAVTSAERAQTRLAGEIRRVELRPLTQRRGTGLTQ